MPATVITIRTVLLPQNKTLTHSIVLANGKARSDNELDRWRLFNLDDNTITYVDDIAKTYYTVPFSGGPRSSAAAEDGGRPQIVATGAKRIVQGVEASQFFVRIGGYQRELWIGAPASIPQQLFGMMNADFSEVRGFPLIDHAELPYGKLKLVVDRSVVKIEQRNVPMSLLNIGSGYQSITAPGASRPPASSPRRGQSTPKAG